MWDRNLCHLYNLWPKISFFICFYNLFKVSKYKDKNTFVWNLSDLCSKSNVCSKNDPYCIYLFVTIFLHWTLRDHVSKY